MDSVRPEQTDHLWCWKQRPNWMLVESITLLGSSHCVSQVKIYTKLGFRVVGETYVENWVGTGHVRLMLQETRL